MAPKIQAAGLSAATGNDVLDGWVTDMANRENYRNSRDSNSSQVVGKSEDWPIIRDSTEGSVLSICKASIVDKLCANGYIWSSLECGTDSLRQDAQFDIIRINNNYYSRLLLSRKPSHLRTRFNTGRGVDSEITTNIANDHRSLRRPSERSAGLDV